MRENPPEIRAFNVQIAPRHEVAAVHALATRLRAESWPEDPPRTLEHWERKLRSVPPYWSVHRWVAWKGDQAIASANVFLYAASHNRHIADCDIAVLADHRRRGIGKALLDPALMEKWRNEGPRDLFTLGWWMGPYPEEDLASICALKAVMNTAPRDELQMEDRTWTPEMLRQGEAALAERNTERWTLYARHRARAYLAGG
ncbi:MAG TPA: N-acetyltransferase [Candidatus Acetothermia bacterium]|nr:N-acetyltransferase [Candidatus Acetothermia bacterium]